MNDSHLIKIELDMLQEGMTTISRRFEEVINQSEFDQDIIEELRSINQLARQLVESAEIISKRAIAS